MFTRDLRGTSRRCLALSIPLLCAASLLSGCSGGPGIIRIGAVFPLHGSQSALARQEYLGVQVAVDAVNRRGGVAGRQVVLDVRSAETPEEASGAVASLAADGVPAVIGAYSSQLSIPAASSAARHHVVYWEAGAVADRLTGSASPWVFRVGADGSQLGTNSASFASAIVVPRLGLSNAGARIAVVSEDDSYGTSVAQGVLSRADALGFQIAPEITYDAYRPDWPAVISQVVAAQPDILFLASYIPDGVAFRRAMLAARVKVGALIGTTMAECVPDFGGALGDAAIGVFGSDRPGPDFNPATLSATGRRAYDVLSTAVRRQGAPTVRAQPTEEELSGYTAAWALLHDVVPKATGMSSSDIAGSARHTILAAGTLPNGAGLHFSAAKSTLGQNLLATGAIWQWQAAGYNVVVWPPTFATGSPVLIPLPVSTSAGPPAGVHPDNQSEYRSGW